MIADRPTPDTASKVIAVVFSALVNVGLFGSMAFASLHKDPVEEQPTFEWVAVEPIAKLGVEKDKRALPKITQAPAPEIAPKEALHLGPREEEPDPAAPKPEIAIAEEPEAPDPDELERARKRQEVEDRRRKAREKRKRRRALEQILNNVDDPRAAEDEPEGIASGSAFGTSTTATARNELSIYAAQLGRVLERNFEVPAAIPQSQRKRMKVQVYFRLQPSAAGLQVKGTPKLRSTSGNRHFDNAAMRAVRKFQAGSPVSLPPPPNPRIRQQVLQEGIKAIMRGGQ